MNDNKCYQYVCLNLGGGRRKAIKMALKKV